MNENKIYYVYEWIRLDTNEPFYVGKGHGDRYFRTNSRSDYFKNIYKKVPTAVSILIENLSEKEALEYECWYINEYKFVFGYDLCNLTDGGDGISGYKHTEENIKKNRMQTHGFDIEEYKDNIIDMYCNKSASTYDIANTYGVSDVCIGRVLRKFSIPLRISGQGNVKYTGLKRYNTKCVLIKDINNNIIDCFESFTSAGIWISKIGLTNHPNGGKKAIRVNIDTNINYKGLLFYAINTSEYYDYNLNRNDFVNFYINDLNIQSAGNSNIIEMYGNKNTLINTFGSLTQCANWLVETKFTNSFSSANDAIYRSNKNNKFYKKQYKFKIYSKSEYNQKINQAV